MSVSFSIVIPTCNRVQQLEQLIESLIKSIKVIENECECEIIVSDDSTNLITKKFIETNFPEISWIKGPQQGPGANRNYGALSAIKTWLVFIDDDCYVNEGFLARYLNRLKQSSDKVLEGKIICPNKKNSIFVRQPENSQGGVLASGNFAIEKSLFEKIGGFDEDLKIMEDMEFANRLENLGQNYTFCENSIAFHPSQPKKLGFYFNWVFHFKWQLLLSYKCGQRNIKESFLSSLLRTVYDHILLLVRITYHLISKFDKDRWVMYSFERILAWFTLPICLPYLVFWTMIYRTKIKSMEIKIPTINKRVPLEE